MANHDLTQRQSSHHCGRGGGRGRGSICTYLYRLPQTRGESKNKRGALAKKFQKYMLVDTYQYIESKINRNRRGFRNVN